MSLHPEWFLLSTGVLLLISIYASKLSDRIGIPALLFFLLIGMLAGSEGLGGIYFDNPQLTQFVGIIALIFILFTAGLDTEWQQVKPVLISGLSLASIGVFLTAALMAVLVYSLLNFSLQQSFLLGAIVSSTDAAAIFALLKSKQDFVSAKLNNLVAFESASNDPMAVLLTIWIIDIMVNPGGQTSDYLLMFLGQVAIGSIVGYIMGRLSPWLINQITLPQQGLYPVMMIGLMLATYSITALLHGSGFLAVYLCGLLTAKCDFLHKEYIRQFFDAATWLMHIFIFLALGLLVFPSQLIDVIGIDTFIALFIMLLARPLSVLGSLSFSQFHFKEKLMVSWMGLRGAVPIILATFPRVAGVPNADLIFNIVFFVVLCSILIQGTTLRQVAKWLHVSPKQT